MDELAKAREEKQEGRGLEELYIPAEMLEEKLKEARLSFRASGLLWSYEPRLYEFPGFSDDVGAATANLNSQETRLSDYH